MSATETSIEKKLWSIDPDHSEVIFKVKHLVITTVTGRFNTFTGSVKSDGDNFDGAKVSTEIDINSINTNSADRDAHLKSEDFFNAEQHPKMTFEGEIKKVGSDYKLIGDLTIRGTSRQVEMDVNYAGSVKDPWGNLKAGFEVEGKLNRKDWGLTWNAVTESGGMLVGEEVKLQMSVQLSEA